MIWELCIKGGKGGSPVVRINPNHARFMENWLSVVSELMALGFRGLKGQDYNQLKEELLTEDEIGACLAAYEYGELSENDILNFSTNNQITTNRYGIISIGPFKYYSFDDLILAQDAASQLLQDELTPEKLEHTAIKTLQKFANESCA